MSCSKVVFFACLIGSVLNLSGYTDESNAPPPKLKNGPRVQMNGKRPQIVVTDLEGQTLTAKKTEDKVWAISGMDLKGAITIDSKAGSANFQSSSKDAPLQSLTVTVSGSTITTLVNPKGQKRIRTTSPDGYTTQVDVVDSSGNTMTAIRKSEGVWEISGIDMSNQAVKGSLSIDSNTGFVAYKGSNGSFMYKKAIPIEFIIVGLAFSKVPITNKVAEEAFVDDTTFPEVSSGVRVQMQKLLKSILEENGS